MSRAFSIFCRICMLAMAAISVSPTETFESLRLPFSFFGFNEMANKTAFVYWFALLSCAVLLVSIFNQRIYFRIAAAFFFTALIFVPYLETGKINNNRHIWIFAAILMIFFDPNKSMQDRTNRLVIRLLQVTLLCEYLNSGIWKLRMFARADSWGAVLGAPLDHIAYSIAEGNGPAAWLRGSLASPFVIVLIQVGFFAILLFQFGAVLPIVTARYLKTWAVFAVLFHLSTGVFLGIWFRETIVAALVFLIVAEVLYSKAPTQEPA